MAEKSIRTLLWRGALGGIVGNILGAAFWWPFYDFHYGRGTHLSYYFLFIVIYSPIAAVVGVVIAAILRWIDLSTGRNLGIIARGVVGASFAGGGGVIASYLLYSNIDRAYLGLSYTMFYAKYGLILGAVAGIIVGSQNHSKLK